MVDQRISLIYWIYQQDESVLRLIDLGVWIHPGLIKVYQPRCTSPRSDPLRSD